MRLQQAHGLRTGADSRDTLVDTALVESGVCAIAPDVIFAFDDATDIITFKTGMGEVWIGYTVIQSIVSLAIFCFRSLCISGTKMIGKLVSVLIAIKIYLHERMEHLA